MPKYENRKKKPHFLNTNMNPGRSEDAIERFLETLGK